MANYTSRFELKSIVSAAKKEQVLQLLFGLEKVKLLKMEKYKISTTYLLIHKNEKSHGKLRVREYGRDCYIEEKIKKNGKTFKNRWRISLELFEELRGIDDASSVMAFLHEKDISVSEEFSNAKRTENLKIEYEREAYEFLYEDELYRVTFDCDFYYSDNVVGRTSHELRILEIKCGENKKLTKFLQDDAGVFFASISKYRTFQRLANYARDCGIQYDGIEDEFKLYFDYDTDYFSEIMNAFNDKFVLMKKKNKEITDLYFDTEDLYFRRHDIGYRIRLHKGSDERILNLKLPRVAASEMFSRFEYKYVLENTVETSRVALLPCKINETLRTKYPKVCLTELKNVLAIRTNREFYEIKDNYTPDRWVLGFVCIDHSKVVSSGKTYAMRPQLEIELNLEFDENHVYSKQSEVYIAAVKEVCEKLSGRGFEMSERCKYDIACSLAKGE